MTGYEIVDIMEKIAPKELACDWDHVGIMAGSPDMEITGIMLCLDLTQEVLEEAVGEGCNMIITHHPLIFHPLKTLSEERPSGRLVANIVRENMLVLSAHTNLDFTEGGVNESLIKQLGVNVVYSDKSGHHRYGELPSAMTLKDFVNMVDESLCAEGVKVVMPEGVNPMDLVKRVGVSCGGFDGETKWVYDYDVDVLVTGEVKHAEALSLEMEDFATVAAGHYATEIWGVDGLAMMLGEYLLAGGEPDAPEVFVSSASRNPFSVL